MPNVHFHETKFQNFLGRGACPQLTHLVCLHLPGARSYFSWANSEVLPLGLFTCIYTYSRVTCLDVIHFIVGKKNRGLSVIGTLRRLQQDQLSEEDVNFALLLGWCIEWVS